MPLSLLLVFLVRRVISEALSAGVSSLGQLDLPGSLQESLQKRLVFECFLSLLL